jgi:hypothetical protein
VEILFLADRTGHRAEPFPASLTKVPPFGEREMPMGSGLLAPRGMADRNKKAGLTPAFS